MQYIKVMIEISWWEK